MALRSIVSKLRGTATFTTSTAPKLKAYTPTAEFAHQEYHHQHGKKPVKGDYVPVYVALGMIALSVSFGLITAKQQVLYSPNVRVKKKTREIVSEVDDPDRVVGEADRFVKKSFFRKVAHIQEFDNGLLYLPDENIRKDVFGHDHPHVETLKSVGIDTKPQMQQH